MQDVLLIASQTLLPTDHELLELLSRGAVGGLIRSYYTWLVDLPVGCTCIRTIRYTVEPLLKDTPEIRTPLY